MTGDSVSEHHRNDLLSHVKVSSSRRATRTLDKEVQYDLADAMDYEHEPADSGIGGSGELVTVEINSSPSSPSVSVSDSSGNTSAASEHNHNSIIRRDSIEKLRALEETDVTLCPLDIVDGVTLTDSLHLDSSTLDDNSDGVDEIKEQLSLVPMNNCANSNDKLKELSEGPVESNCALDCLSFTIQCCECTIL